MKFAVVIALLIGTAPIASAQDWPLEIVEASKQKYAPIDLSRFNDNIGHWMRKYGRDYPVETYSEDQIIHIAESLLRYQNEDGGWPKDVHWYATMPEEKMRSIMDAKHLARSTFDNRTTHSHIAYLAEVRHQTGLKRYGDAANRGLEYVFRGQRASGGWRGSDVDAITYNDSVMTGVMRLLRDIAEGKPQYAWLDDVRREKATEAYHRALDVTLACQIKVDDRLTGWCQQHSHETLEPVKARTYELPSICGAETNDIVKFLMEIEKPSPEVIASVDAATTWLDRVGIEGIRIETIDIEPVRYRSYTSTIDRIIVEDPDAPRLWARYYDLETEKPFFANRDGSRVYTLAEVEHERRTGYGWYSGAPESTVKHVYPQWRKRNGLD